MELNEYKQWAERELYKRDFQADAFWVATPDEAAGAIKEFHADIAWALTLSEVDDAYAALSHTLYTPKVEEGEVFPIYDFHSTLHVHSSKNPRLRAKTRNRGFGPSYQVADARRSWKLTRKTQYK